LVVGQCINCYIPTRLAGKKAEVIGHRQIYVIHSGRIISKNIGGSEGERRVSARVVESGDLARMG